MRELPRTSRWGRGRPVVIAGPRRAHASASWRTGPAVASVRPRCPAAPTLSAGIRRRAPTSAGWVAFAAPTTALRPIDGVVGHHRPAHCGPGPDHRVAHDHAVPDLGAGLDPDPRADDRVDHRPGDVGAGGEPGPVQFGRRAAPGPAPGPASRSGSANPGRRASSAGGPGAVRAGRPGRTAACRDRANDRDARRSATVPAVDHPGQQSFAVIAQIAALPLQLAQAVAQAVRAVGEDFGADVPTVRLVRLVVDGADRAVLRMRRPGSARHRCRQAVVVPTRRWRRRRSPGVWR